MSLPPAPGRPPWLRDDPRFWRAGTLDRPGLQATAAALAREPGFDAWMRRFAECWLATQDMHPPLRAVFRNTPRYLLLVASLVLHHQRNPADPASGVTASRLLAFFDERVAPVLNTSAGQVKSMLAHARLSGFLQPQPGPADARLRPLQPSPLLRQVMSDWVAGFLRAMADVPGLTLPVPPTELLATPGLVAEMFSYRLSAVGQDRFALYEGQPPLRWVLAHDGGYRVYLQLLSVARPQADGSALAPLSAAALARRAGVSRGTVRNLMADAAHQGWQAAIGAEGAGWHASADAVAVARHWVALELVWMHGLLLAAWTAQQGARPAAG
jgi:hypothetical protein